MGPSLEIGTNKQKEKKRKIKKKGKMETSSMWCDKVGSGEKLPHFWDQFGGMKKGRKGGKDKNKEGREIG